MRLTFTKKTSVSRSGAAAVEMALVVFVLLMLIFGIFEYARFLFVMHVTHNAARDAARYAAVNLDKPSNFSTTDFTNAAGETYVSINNYAIARMAGIQNQLTNFQIAVYPVDNNGLYSNPPIIRPKSKIPSIYPDPFNPSDPNHVPWNQADYTEKIAVTIRGDFRSILPNLLFMQNTIHIRITGMSTAEG
ncbi:MAG: pilus assembly protein [Thermogemmata sp.]|nr:pilus assembly protein [Thermogemmata sp.]